MASGGWVDRKFLHDSRARQPPPAAANAVTQRGFSGGQPPTCRSPARLLRPRVTVHRLWPRPHRASWQSLAPRAHGARHETADRRLPDGSHVLLRRGQGRRLAGRHARACASPHGGHPAAAVRHPISCPHSLGHCPPRRRRAAGSGRLPGGAGCRRPGPAAHPAHRAERRRVRGGKWRRPHPRDARRGRCGASRQHDDLRVRPETAVRHCLLAPRPVAALRLCGGNQPGRALSVSCTATCGLLVRRRWSSAACRPAGHWTRDLAFSPDGDAAVRLGRIGRQPGHRPDRTAARPDAAGRRVER